MMQYIAIFNYYLNFNIKKQQAKEFPIFALNHPNGYA